MNQSLKVKAISQTQNNISERQTIKPSQISVMDGSSSRYFREYYVTPKNGAHEPFATPKNHFDTSSKDKV